MNQTNTHEPARLLQGEQNAHLRLQKLNGQYLALEAEASGIVADGGEIGEISQRLAALKLEGNLIQTAIDGIRKKRLQTIPLAREAALDKLRDQAAELRAEAEKLNASCDRHLAR